MSCYTCICIISFTHLPVFVYFSSHLLMFSCSCFEKKITHIQLLMYISPHLPYRPMSLELEDLQNESPSGSLMQPISAMIQPITDTLRRRLRTSTTPFYQSVLTSALCRAAGFHRKHEQPDYRRWTVWDACEGGAVCEEESMRGKTKD